MSEPTFPEMKLKSELRMPAEKVVELYELFENNGVEIWVDGGWGVDALLGEQTREHADLDIALSRAQEPKLRELLDARGFKVIPTDDQTDWNYVVSNGTEQIDLHVFEFDSEGNNTYGTAYPHDSLTGTGSINGTTVRTIHPEWMVKFHTGYNIGETDRHDVALLCEKYGIELPEQHKIDSE